MMQDNLARYEGAISNTPLGWIIRKLILPLFDRQTSLALNSAGLAIHGAASALAKTGASVCYFLANGVFQKIAASTDMPALVGTVTNATFNVFAFFIDQNGTVTSAMGTQGATIGAMKFPQFPTGKALIGFIIINPTGTGDFVGGTTALDDGTVAPNAVYVNGQCGFDPFCLTGL